MDYKTNTDLCKNGVSLDQNQPLLKTICKTAPVISYNQKLLWAAHGWMYPFVCFKTSLRVKMSGFAYLGSVWHRDKMQHGNGLLDECRKHSWVKSVKYRKYRKIKNLLIKCDAEVLMSKYGWLLTPFRWLNSNNYVLHIWNKLQQSTTTNQRAHCFY